MTILHAGSRSRNERRIPVKSWLARLNSEIQLTPVRMAAAYLVLGFSALFLSDVLLVQYLQEPLLSQVQAVKAGVEVLLTAGFILVVTRRREVQLARKQRDIEHQREELQVLHRVLRHNLRNDVNVVEGHAELIRDRVSDAGLEDSCGKIIEKTNQMTHYTDQAKRINRITELNGAIRTEDLSTLIPEVLDQHPYTTDEVAVETFLPERAEVEVNPMFREALDELFSNAVEHNDSDTPTLTVAVDSGAGRDGFTTIRIEDNGPGIPESQLLPLKEGKEHQLLHLDGMGLWLVEWTIENSGGTVEFHSRDTGTEVVIAVPNPSSLLPASLREIEPF